MRYLAMSAVALAAVAAAPASAQEFVTNGNFEAPLTTAPYTTLSGTDLTGWTIKAGTNIDIVRAPSYAVVGQAVDLNGTADGTNDPQATITQTLAGLMVGQIYRVTFQYVGNGGGAYSATVGTGTQLFTGRGPSANNVNGQFSSTAGVNSYTSYVANFIAGSTSQTLSFASGNGGNGGIFLDNVSVTAVPEAATWAMMIIGFGAVGGALRRRRAHDGSSAGDQSFALV